MNKKYMLSSLVTLILLAMLILAVAGGRRFPLVNKVVATVLLPVEDCVNVLLHEGDNIRDFWHSLILLREKNEVLVKKNQELQQQNVQLESLIAENKDLHKLLEYKRQNKKQSLVPARVVARNFGDLRDTVYIDAGSAHKVDRDMAVVTSSGLIGIIDEVYDSYSRVLLISSSNCRVGCRVIKDGQHHDGIVHGFHETDGLLLMEHIQREATVNSDDLVVTNGYSGKHPANIIIGKVLSVQMDGAGLLQEAEVEPVADLNGAEYVFVIVDFSPRLETKKSGRRKQ